MGTVTYMSIGGEILSENRDGVIRDYVPDPLGSTVAMLDAMQTKTDEVTYWPYGEVRSRTGTNGTPFLFLGTLGYHTDTSGKTYVRARVLEPKKARWLTEDPLFLVSPEVQQYVYAGSSPLTASDRSGLGPRFTTICVPCPPALVAGCLTEQIILGPEWTFVSCRLCVTYAGKPPITIYCNWKRTHGGRRMVKTGDLNPITGYVDCIGDCILTYLSGGKPTAQDWTLYLLCAACCTRHLIMPGVFD